MFLYIFLTLWMFIVLMIGLRPDAIMAAKSWPEKPKKENVRSNLAISTIISAITMAVLWFITAFRSSNIGNDTETYLYYFNIFSKNLDMTRSFEIGYQILNRIIGLFTNDPHIFIIIMATIMYLGVIWYIFKYSKNTCISVCLFFCYFFSIFTTMMRQGIAMIIVLYGYQMLKQDKKIKAAILFLLATTFHTTAIISFLFFLRTELLKKRWFVLLLTIFCIAITSTGILNTLVSLVVPRYSHYFDSRYASSGWLSVSISLIIYYLWYILINKSINKNNKSDQLVATNFTLLLISAALGYSVNLFTRSGEYFLLIAITELPNMLFRGKNRNYRLTLFTLCSILLALFIITLIFRPGWNHLYPYEFWG